MQDKNWWMVDGGCAEGLISDPANLANADTLAGQPHSVNYPLVVIQRAEAGLKIIACKIITQSGARPMILRAAAGGGARSCCPRMRPIGYLFPRHRFRKFGRAINKSLSRSERSTMAAALQSSPHAPREVGLQRSRVKLYRDGKPAAKDLSAGGVFASRVP